MPDFKQMNSHQEKENKVLLGAMGIVVIVVAVLAIIGFLFMNKPAEIIEGQADATSVRVSGKLPGRVVDIYVAEGDMVRKGDTLIHIHSSLADARLEQAQSMENAAKAMSEKVDAGTRSQIIAAAQSVWQQAEAAVGIAKKTYDRMQNLYAEGVVSEQKRDEAKAAYDASVAGAAAAKSQYELAKAGAQKEDKAGAEAMVNAAKGGVGEVEALLEDQYLTAPCDGQIDVIYPHVGELVALGTPLMSVLRLDDKWVTFNVREEYLNDMKLGSEMEVMIPALDKKKIKVKIYYVRDLGSYATWHATKTTGDWDSKTFEVKARPMEAIPDLRPGMTVVYKE